VIVFKKNLEFSVGRRVNNDITVSDISVSRKQSVIRLDEETDKLYVEDCDSKFGTFVKLRGPVKIKEGQRVPLQIEKKVLFLNLQSRFSCWNRCLLRCNLKKDDIIESDNYEDYRDKFPKELERVLLKPGYL
jgi:hypothetical protein